VAVSIAPARTERVIAGRPELVAGASELVDEAGPVHVRAAFGAFVQSHRAQATELARRVAAHVTALGPEPRVLELFAGSGALGLAAAKAGARVTMVEAFEPAARGIAASASSAGLSCEAFADDAARFVSRAVAEGETFDAVVVDPPRRGLPPELRLAIAALAPRAVIYVACGPATWARDAAHLTRLGWPVSELSALDMMPHTDEVELVSLHLRGTPLAARAVELPSGVRLLELSAHDPTAAASRPRGASGLFGASALPRAAEWTALALVQGVPRPRGRLTREATYRRVSVAGGHGVLDVTGSGPVGAILPALARIGHPVHGDARASSATNEHFFEKHGLDRLALHVGAVRLGDAHAEAPLPGDLAGVLSSLRATPTSSTRAEPRRG
jgi:23S rRNA (uracil1939-C5)-methyltransferase